MKIIKKLLIGSVALTLTFCVSCGSTHNVTSETSIHSDSNNAVMSSSKESKAGKNLYKGAGLVIAVTSPEVRNGGKSENWMSQFFQDSITGNFAKYSKMTVLDRANENLTKAEQELSETGFYTEENAVQLGQMTNAQYAVFGSITVLSSSYELNFRAIDITTNEIKAAYNDRATAADIENGTSVKEIVASLFEGLGFQLSEKEKQQLTKTDSKSVNATKSLAKGAAAEKADNLIEALAFYTEAQQNGATKKEASEGINSILGTNGTVSGNAIANLKAQAAWEKQQVEKWNKIFSDLSDYVRDNTFIAVYDFSKIEMSLNSKYNTVELKSTGAKIVPVRSTLIIVNKIFNEWVKIRDAKENSQWSKNVKLQRNLPSIPYYKKVNMNYSSTLLASGYRLIAGVYDNTGYLIKEGQCYPLVTGYIDVENIKPQKNYFNDRNFEELGVYGIKLEDLPDDSDLEIRPIEVEFSGGDNIYKIHLMSIDEYNDWVKNQ